MATNELRDCSELLYKGREVQQISASEEIHTGIELSNLVSSKTELKFGNIVLAFLIGYNFNL